MVLSGLNDDGAFACIDECPECGKANAKVIDSRLDDSLALRVRRKECKHCGHRWNTIELCEADFECIAGLTEARELVALKQASGAIHEQIKSLQENVMRLTNAAANIDRQLTGKKQTSAKKSYQQTTFRYSK